MTQPVHIDPSRRVKVIEAVLKQTDSLTDPIDLRSYHLVGVFMPDQWTASDLAFQASDKIDGGYLPVYDSDNNEQLVNAAANRAIAFNRANVSAADTGTFTPIRIFNFVKIRSVNPQAADRLLKLVMVSMH